MSSLHLMTMRADIVRVSIARVEPGAGLDPFNQAEPGAPAPFATNVPCELFSVAGDIIVNERRSAARALWRGIIDMRAGVRAGDLLTNVRRANGDPLFLEEPIFPGDDRPNARKGAQRAQEAQNGAEGGKGAQESRTTHSGAHRAQEGQTTTLRTLHAAPIAGHHHIGLTLVRL